MQQKSESVLKVKSTHEGKPYRAHFEVDREKIGTRTYKLHAQVRNSKDEIVFEKDRTGLDYSQVEPAIIFVFHQAFAL